MQLFIRKYLNLDVSFRLSKTNDINNSNEEINDIMKIIEFLGESGWLIKDVSEKIENEAKEQKRGFIRML